MNILFLVTRIILESFALKHEKDITEYTTSKFIIWSDYFGAILSIMILLNKNCKINLEQDISDKESSLSLIFKSLDNLYKNDFFIQKNEGFPNKHHRLGTIFTGIFGYMLRMQELHKGKELIQQEKEHILLTLVRLIDKKSNLFTAYSKNDPDTYNGIEQNQFNYRLNTMILTTHAKVDSENEPILNLLLGTNHNNDMVKKILDSKETIHMQAGDILLVHGENALSKPIAKIQRVKYWRVRSSHVLIVVAEGIFLHATGTDGVSLRFYRDELNEIKANWRMIRLKEMDKFKVDAIMQSILYFNGQDYNIKFTLENEDKSFCSELVAKIYKHAEISILNDKLPHKVIPADFDKEADKQDKWKDITIETKNDFRLMDKEIKLYYLNYYNFKFIIDNSRKSKHMVNKMMKIGYENNLFTKELHEFYMEFEKNYDDKKHFKLWDDKLKR